MRQLLWPTLSETVRDEVREAGITFDEQRERERGKQMRILGARLQRTRHMEAIK